MRAQAEQMRYQRMILAEERVNKLPVKLLIPLVFFIFPSISVILIGPAILQVSENMPKISASKEVRPGNANLQDGILGKNPAGKPAGTSLLIAPARKATGQQPLQIIKTGEFPVQPVASTSMPLPGALPDNQ